jgi:hypothetical protein
MRGMCRSLLLLVVLSSTGLVWPAAFGDSPTPRAGELIDAHNARSFGDTGWRRVRLELKDGDRVTRSFTVVNLWRREAAGVATLFVLERPDSLRGTNYLLTERPRELENMRVHLHLPAGRRRVLAIQPGRFDEGLLGSDFSYRDLRMQIPTAGYRFRVVGSTRMLDRSVWKVEAVPAGGAADSWQRSVYYLSSPPTLLLGIDRFRARDDRVPAKRLRVHGVRQVDGAWTETRMVMSVDGGRSSELTLSSFRPGLPGIGPDLFEPELLAEILERLPAGAVERHAAEARR